MLSNIVLLTNDWSLQRMPTALNNFLVNMSMCALKDNRLSSIIRKYLVH